MVNDRFSAAIAEINMSFTLRITGTYIFDANLIINKVSRAQDSRGSFDKSAANVHSPDSEFR